MALIKSVLGEIARRRGFAVEGFRMDGTVSLERNPVAE